MILKYIKLNSLLNEFLIFVCLLTSFLCDAQVTITEEKVVYQEFEIPLYETSLKKIEKHFGIEYQVINWNDYSTENLYEAKGISFSYKQSDSINKMIYWINVKTKGNLINVKDKLKVNEKTVVSEIVDVFGNGEWEYDSTYNGLIIEYEYFDFVVKLTDENVQILSNNSGDDNWEKYYDIFKNNLIEEIEIY